MAQNPNSTKCSHCGAADSIIETLEVFYCDECGWWGTEPDKIIHEEREDEDFRKGQVPRRPIS